MLFRNKFVKLAILFIIAFVFVLLGNLFLLSPAPQKPEISLNAGVSEISEQIVIKDSTITPELIVIPVYKMFQPKIRNDDNITHRVIWLRKTKQDENYSLLHEYYIPPKSEKKIELKFICYKPSKEELADIQKMLSKEEYDLFLSQWENLFSCTTCYGKNSQVKVVCESE